MKKKNFPVFKSIFLKLIILVIFFGVLLNLSIWAFFRLSMDVKPKKIVPVYIAKMNDYIVKDLGFPPDTLKAKKLSDELNINIRFQSHQFNWTTSDYVPMLEELARSDDFKDKFPYKESFMMQHEKKPYYVAKSSQGIYIIAPLSPQDFFNPERAIVIVILLISFILILLYFLLRWLFSPMKELSSAVNQIAQGNYNINIPVKRKDELGELASSINDMSVRIKQNIKAKEQLLIDVSHELRTPLTRMKLGLEVDSPKEKINEDVDEMERMITELIENYRSDTPYEKLNRENTDIVKLLKDVIEASGSPQKINLETATNSPVILNVDPHKIKTAFRNLIDNALKYSSDSITVSVTTSDHAVTVSVKDVGIGIAEEDLKYIFEPFYRADPSRSRKTGGFGLGLAICKRIIEAHGGSILIKSKVNEGTEVFVSLSK
jgi:signal transduction histidine kinase